MPMNPRRALRTSQQALNEAVEQLLDSGLDESRGMTAELQPAYNTAALLLMERWREFDIARRALEDPGAASARYTSIAAAHTDLPAKETHRRNVIDCVVSRWNLYGTGSTCEQIVSYTRKMHQSISSAVNYCEQAGWIRDSGQRRPTRFKREAIVYVPTDLALEATRLAAAS